MESAPENLQLQVNLLEKKVRCLAAGFVALLACAAVMAQRENARADSAPHSLTVRRLAVVDAMGVERVVIAAPLPDPIVHGKRSKRDGAVSGILIYDPKGNERGGYVTNEGENSAAFLTLDSEDSQVFTAYANASGKQGAMIGVQSASRDSILLTTDQQPRIEIRQSGKIVQKIPDRTPDSR